MNQLQTALHSVMAEPVLIDADLDSFDMLCLEVALDDNHEFSMESIAHAITTKQLTESDIDTIIGFTGLDRHDYDQESVDWVQVGIFAAGATAIVALIYKILKWVGIIGKKGVKSLESESSEIDDIDEKHEEDVEKTVDRIEKKIEAEPEKKKEIVDLLDVKLKQVVAPESNKVIDRLILTKYDNSSTKNLMAAVSDSIKYAEDVASEIETLSGELNDAIRKYEAGDSEAVFSVFITAKDKFYASQGTKLIKFINATAIRNGIKSIIGTDSQLSVKDAGNEVSTKKDMSAILSGMKQQITAVKKSDDIDPKLLLKADGLTKDVAELLEYTKRGFKDIDASNNACGKQLTRTNKKLIEFGEAIKSKKSIFSKVTNPEKILKEAKTANSWLIGTIALLKDGLLYTTASQVLTQEIMFSLPKLAKAHYKLDKLQKEKKAAEQA